MTAEKDAMSTIDLKLAETVLRTKIIEAAAEQRRLREEKKELLFRANVLLGRGDTMRHSVHQQVCAVHQERIGRRRLVRYLAVAYAFALGRPYAAQEAKALRPIHAGSLADDLLDTQSEVNSTMKRAVLADIESWIKGEPTAAQREALAKVEAAIVAAQ